MSGYVGVFVKGGKRGGGGGDTLVVVWKNISEMGTRKKIKSLSNIRIAGYDDYEPLFRKVRGDILKRNRKFLLEKIYPARHCCHLFELNITLI